MTELLSIELLKKVADDLSKLPQTTIVSNSSTQVIRTDQSSDLTRTLAGVPHESPQEVAKLKSALSLLTADAKRGNGSLFDHDGKPTDDYWLGVVWGIRSLRWTCGESIAREWSQTITRAPYSEEGFQTAWNSFDPTHKKPITIKSVYKLAAIKGWQQSEGVMQADLAPKLPHSSLSTTTLSSGGAARDVQLANAFVSLKRDGFRYVFEYNRWIRWNGNHWAFCDVGEEVEAAKDVVVHLLDQARAELRAGESGATERAKEALNAHKVERLMAMLKLARSDPAMATTAQALDNNPMLLGCNNGVIDLEKGSLMPSDPKYLNSKVVNASYISDPTCPHWTKFLFDIFEHDVETMEAVQRLVGYTLIGEVREEVIVICFGFGANGKSVFSNVINNVLGDYAKTAPPSILAARRGDDHRPRDDLAALRGARYVSVNETQAGDRLDEQVVKALAGREPIAARPLYGQYFSFRASFKVWLRTNHKPIIVGDDHGIWRRLVLVPFSRTFKPEEQDQGLEQMLLEERDGIFAWMLDGIRMYLRDGIVLSPRMKYELTSYRKESDLLGEFLDDSTVLNPQAAIEQRTLYASYGTWCQDSGVRPLSKKSFTQRLKERGIQATHSGGTRRYVGIEFVKVDHDWQRSVPTPETVAPSAQVH
jgi:putative DNA primase/helicase